MATTRKTRPQNYGSFDIEATNWNNFQIACVYNGDTPIFSKSARELAAHLEAHAKENMVWYAHVGGKYDFKFILRELLQKYFCTFRVISGSLAQIKCYRVKKKDKNGKIRYSGRVFELRDSFHLLPSGLEKLIHSFGVTSCVSLSHIDWKWYSKCKDMREEIFKLDEQELHDYVAVDCIALLEIMKKARELFGQKLKITTAGQAFSEWEKIEDTRAFKIPAVFDDYIRKAYAGGRVEVFEQRITHGYYFDVVSMYPYAMMKEFPAGKVYQTDQEIKNAFGIYTCKVQTPPNEHIPFLHYKDVESKKLLFPLGQWTGVYTSIEIQKARQLGYTITIIDGIAWTHKAKPFAAYVEKWFKVKDDAKKQKDTAMQTIAKLYLNSLYGKTGQRREFTRVVTELTAEDIANGASVLDDEVGLYTITDKDKKPYTMTQLACFVTAYARIRLYEGIEQVKAKCGTVYYCDTDSLITSVPIAEGSQLGDFEQQYEISEGIFLAPKIYALKLVDGGTHIRAKGFNLKKLTYDNFEGTLLRGERFTTERDGVVGFLESCRRGLDFVAVVDKSRELHCGMTKRTVTENHRTKPLIIT